MRISTYLQCVETEKVKYESMHMCTYTYEHMYICVHIHTSKCDMPDEILHHLVDSILYTRISTCLQCVETETGKYVSMHMCIYTHVHMYICVHIHITSKCDMLDKILLH